MLFLLKDFGRKRFKMAIFLSTITMFAMMTKNGDINLS